MHTETEGCEAWLKSLEVGTDNEAYSCAVGTNRDGFTIGTFCLGEDYGDWPRISFCPWCGESVRKTELAQNAAH